MDPAVVLLQSPPLYSLLNCVGEVCPLNGVAPVGEIWNWVILRMHTPVTVPTVCSCVPQQGDDVWAIARWIEGIQFPLIGLGYICCIIYVCIGTSKITDPFIVFMLQTVCTCQQYILCQITFPFTLPTICIYIHTSDSVAASFGVWLYNVSKFQFP